MSNKESKKSNKSQMSYEVKKKKDETPDIDAKTKAVFTKKGYEINQKLGSGAFGQVVVSVSFSVFLSKILSF